VPFNEPETFQHVQQFAYDGLADRADRSVEFSGAETVSGAQLRQNRCDLGAILLVERAVRRFGVQGQGDVQRCLSVEGVCKAGITHVAEHTTDAFAKFLAQLQVRTDTDETRVTGEPRHVHDVREIDRGRERPGARDFDAIIKNVDMDLVALKRVGAVNHCIHESFEPDVFGHEGDVFELEISERTTSGLQFGDPCLGLLDEPRDRRVESLVSHDPLGIAILTMAALVSHDSHTGGGNETLGALREQQDRCNGQLLPSRSGSVCE